LFFKSTAGLEDFEAAAMPHLAALYRTAKFLVHNPTEAEDLVQDVYLEALKSFHRFEPGTNCKAWLFRILFHRLHHLRRRLLKSSLEDTSTDQDSMAAEPPVPQEIKDEDILAALDRVPPAFREVVVMADVEEFSYKEIAETLKLPLGTVMSRLSRGRKMLREELAGVAKSYGIGTGANDAAGGEFA
jgi:RNA polymerase sigma-70 factor (ECF subfamily)